MKKILFRKQIEKTETFGAISAEKEKSTSESQQGFEDVVKERDQALEDLQSVETAFSDLHQRYERVKGVVEGFKKVCWFINRLII